MNDVTISVLQSRFSAPQCIRRKQFVFSRHQSRPRKLRSSRNFTFGKKKNINLFWFPRKKRRLLNWLMSVARLVSFCSLRINEWSVDFDQMSVEQTLRCLSPACPSFIHSAESLRVVSRHNSPVQMSASENSLSFVCRQIDNAAAQFDSVPSLRSANQRPRTCSLCQAGALAQLASKTSASLYEMSCACCAEF